jgi:purine-binding chemotaxis protein CheW
VIGISMDAFNESYILFTLAETTYAVPSRHIAHMEMVEHITAVPNVTSYVEGVVFSRGQVVPVVNLRVRFGFERAPADLRARLLVVKVGERVVGMVVDSAREFATIPASAIQPPHTAIAGLSGDYLEGVAVLGERIVLLLNVNNLIPGPVPTGA